MIDTEFEAKMKEHLEKNKETNQSASSANNKPRKKYVYDREFFCITEEKSLTNEYTLSLKNMLDLKSNPIKLDRDHIDELLPILQEWLDSTADA